MKEGVYILDHPEGAEELLKDVAGFANSQVGGLLLVGFSTRVENGEEIVDQIRPVPRELVDLDRHRKLLERIIPTPLYVTVDWIDRGDDKGILVIDVPAQPPACLPYLVPGPARTCRDSRLAAALPVRDGDRTRWLVPEDLQRLVAPGWVQKGSYSDLTGCVPGPALIVKLGAHGADLLQAEGVKDQRSRRPRRHGSDERQVGGKLGLVPVDELEYVGPPPGIWLRARPGLRHWIRRLVQGAPPVERCPYRCRTGPRYR